MKHRWKSQEDSGGYKVFGGTGTNWPSDPLAPFFPGGNPLCSPQGPPSPKPADVGNKPLKVQQGRASKHRPESCCLLHHTWQAGVSQAWGWPKQESTLTPQTAETGFTCATAFPPCTREQTCCDCKIQVSSSHAEEAPLQMGFVAVPSVNQHCLCLGCWTAAMFQKHRKTFVMRAKIWGITPD